MSSLRVALLSYRGAPHSGGQGVYVRQLSRALRKLGHHVEVFGGQPYPELDAGISFHPLPSLELYRPEEPFRRNRRFADWVDVVEFGTMSMGGYPEPLSFSLRAARALRTRSEDFDVVHDNQCLAYGLLSIVRRLPTLATVHHPVSIDLRVELAHASWKRGVALRRWYAFTRMQRRVARRLPRLITVSDLGAAEVERELGVPRARVGVVPNGVDTEMFKPLPHRRRVPGRLVATASADVPLKGLVPLLEAVAKVRAQRDVELVVIGKARPNGPAHTALAKLGLNGSVRFVSGLEETALVEQYAEAEVAVVPSLYEGFSLPAVEGMACGVPLVATTGGALPEVVGRDGDSALLVPPGDSDALAAALTRALSDEALRRRIGEGGRRRVIEKYTWERTALATVDEYRRVIDMTTFGRTPTRDLPLQAGGARVVGELGGGTP